jgi:hypothetical protein
VLPVAGIKLGIGRRLYLAGDAEQRAEGIERVEAPVEGDSALPLKAKRHTNREIWTAAEAQLAPYARSARSAGHGVYLIFWFGTAAGKVSSPPGGVNIESVSALKAELESQLSSEQRGLVEVVVLNVSPPPEKTKKRLAPRKDSRSTKNRSKTSARIGS